MSETLFAVVGAGQMGRCAIAQLLQGDPELRLRVFDRSVKALERAVALEPDRVEARSVDGGSGEILDLTGCVLVLNLAGPFYAAEVPLAARSALEHGCSYVDICDDVEGAQELINIDQSARRSGLSFISGAGLSPGLTNLLAKLILEDAPECDSISVVWATREADPGGLAPLRHMLHMAVTPCPQWREGRMVHTRGFVPETAASYQFPEPVGEIECYDTAHPEPLLLSRSFPQLSDVSCQGAMLPNWANAAFSAVARLGFGDSTLTVPFGGDEIDPQEFLWRTLWARHERRRDAKEVVDLSGIQVLGSQDHRPVVRRTLIDRGSMDRGTSLGAVTVALSLLEQGLPPGVHGPEALDTERLFKVFDRLRAPAGTFGDGPLVEWVTD